MPTVVRIVSVALGMLLTPLALTAQSDLDARVQAAVERALPPMQLAGDEWYMARTCSSCHHASLNLVAVAHARERGYLVDDALAGTQLQRSRRETLESNAEIVQGDAGINAQIGQSYRLLGLAASGVAQSANTDAVVAFLTGKQQRDGHWRSESHRPPLEDTEFTATALSLAAIQRYAPPARVDEIARRVERAHDWLVTSEPTTNEERVMRLLGLRWSGGTSAELEQASRALLREQRDDGGWAQIDALGSDAFATGEALVALREAGGLAADDERVLRGVHFLLETQLADGTWHVATRRKTDGLPYFETGFPHGIDQFISCAATCWAISALCSARAAEPSPIWTSTEPKPRAENDEYAFPPLLAAALSGSLDELAAVLGAGTGTGTGTGTEAGTEAVNLRGAGGLTALICAASDGDKLRLLLEHGAEPSARSELGMTAFLAAAARDGGLDALRLLLARGPLPSRDDLALALGSSVLAGDLEKVDLLLAAGASIDAPIESLYGATPIMLATVQGDGDLVRQLLARGAEVDPTSYDGVTPLIIAAIDGQRDALRALLEAGADVAIRDTTPEGPTPLHWAVTTDHGTTQLVEALIAHGAPLDLRDEDGRTPLALAEFHGYAHFAALLRAAGARE